MARLTKQEMWEQILDFYKLRRNVKAAEFFGVTPQTMYSRVKAGNIDFEEIYAKCPRISPDWLLSGGEGNIARDEREGSEAAKKAEANSPSVKAALEALRAEQDAMRRAQDQISGLIELLREKK